MNKEQFLAMSLPYELHGITQNRVALINGIEYEKELSITWRGEKFIGKCGFDIKPILHPLSDLTKTIEHNGEMFVPIKELCNLYGAKFDKPYQNDMCAGFIYGFAAHDVLNLKNIEKNEFWQIHKLIEWHIDICGLIEKCEAIDLNTLPENPYK